MNRKIALLCFTATLLIYGAQGAYAPYLSSYYQLNGLNKFYIGIISSIGPIVAIVIQPLWGIISDRSGKRKQILQLLSICSALVMLIYFINSKPVTLVLASFFYTSFAMAIIPLVNAVITKASSDYSFDYAKVRIGGPIGHSLMPLLVSVLIVTNRRSMFIIAMILYFLLAFAISLMPEEMFKYEKTNKKKNFASRIFDSNEIIFIFALCILNTFGNTVLGTYIGTKIIDMGFSQSLIGILTFVLSVGELPVLMLIKKYSKGWLPFHIMSFAVFISILRLILASFDSIILICICQFIEGLSYMVAFYTAVTYISKHCSPDKVSSAQTILVILESGIGAVLANLLGAYIISRFGIDTSFRMISVGMIVILTLINLFYTIERRKHETGTADL